MASASVQNTFIQRSPNNIIHSKWKQNPFLVNLPGLFERWTDRSLIDLMFFKRESIPSHAHWSPDTTSLEITELKHEFLKSSWRPRVCEQLSHLWSSSIIIKKKKGHTWPLVPSQNSFFCLQLTFDSGRFDMACHLASFKALYFGWPPHYVDLQ